MPLVLNTTTGLVSPQYHVVFNDTFSTTNSLHRNQLPSHWAELFNNSATSYVDEDFTSTNTLQTPILTSFTGNPKKNMPTETSLNMPLAEPSPAPIQTSQNMPLDLNISDNFSPPISPSTQREPISPSLFADTPVPLSSIPVSSFQRETSTTEVEVPLQTSRRDSIADDVTVLAANDWNQHHPYNTRFKKKFIANLSTQPTSSEQLPPSFLPSPQSFLSTTHNSPFASSYLDVPSYCLVASNNPDVLHFGSMQRDPDKSHLRLIWFEKSLIF